MPPRKTTNKRKPPLQVVLSEETTIVVTELASAEKRSQSQMGSILIEEAIAARISASNQHS